MLIPKVGIDYLVNYYLVLGIGDNATQGQVKSGYDRKIARLNAILSNDGSTADEKKIASRSLVYCNTAHAVLSKGISRMEYNSELGQWVAAGKLVSNDGFPPPPPGSV